MSSVQVDSPFVVNLYYSFQTNDKLCLILDLMNGSRNIQCMCVVCVCVVCVFVCVCVYV